MTELSTHRLLSSRGEFREALRDAFAQAAAAGCRELFISDVDFSDWPLGEISVVESLSRWAMSHRRLTVLAHNFEHVQRRHPRWATWRRQWSHIVSCRSLPDIEPGKMPTLWLAPRLLAVRLFDAETARGSVSSEASDVQHSKELLDALLQHSVEAFPVTTLGL